MVQALHLMDVFLCESTQYAAECGFIRNPQPTGHTTQNTVVPNCYNRTNRTGATNNANHRQNDHVHRVIKTRGATLMIYALLCLRNNPVFVKNLTTGIKPACAVRSLPPWRIWMFFAFVLADLVLPLFFMEMVIPQNVDSDVNYLSILPFPFLFVI